MDTASRVGLTLLGGCRAKSSGESWRHWRSLREPGADEGWTRHGRAGVGAHCTHSQGPGHLAGTLSQASIPLDLYPGAGAWASSSGVEQVRGLSGSGKALLCLVLQDLGVGLMGSR